MATAEEIRSARLFESDETAWLELTSEQIRSGRLDLVDFPNLAEYLSDMAGRDRRDVKSRLAILIAHLLKGNHQPERRSGSWLETIESQRQALLDLLESGTLRNQALESLDKAYSNGRRRAIAETRPTESSYPAENPYSLDDVLSMTLEGETA